MLMRRIWSRISPGDAVLLSVALAVIAALLAAAPGGLLDLADRAAYGVCHRLPGHSFTIAGRQLPLCARCSGSYLGALAGLVVLARRGRGRAASLPRARYLLVLGLFVAAWAGDGLNSYLAFFPGLPHLYEPQNLLRLATGALEGAVLAVVVLPLFNRTVWRAAPNSPSIAGWGDVAWLLVGAGAVFAVVGSTWDPLLYPLALLSGVMVVALLGAVNALLVVVLLRREALITRWGQLLAPLCAGVALAMLEVATIGLARAALSESLGLPF